MENILTGRVTNKVLLGEDRVSILSYRVRCLRFLLGDKGDPRYKRDPLEGVQGIESYCQHTHHS